MLKYVIGFFLNLFKLRVSKFALIDSKSIISKQSRVNQLCQIYDSKIESFSYVGPNSKIICVDIGKFCSISNDCSIGLPIHSLKCISTSPIFTSKSNGTGISWSEVNSFDEYKRTIIGNDVWIGTKAIIMGGVKIGDGAIIGAGAIVTKDIPNYAIAVGIPAVVIKYRFSNDIINKLNDIKWWDKSERDLIVNINLFQNDKFNINDLERIKS